MGNPWSKPKPFSANIQPNLIASYIQPHYFILPLQYQDFHANFQARIKDTYTNLIVFKSREELINYRQDDKNNILVISCNNITQLNQALKIPNFYTFNRIALAYNFHIEERGELEQRHKKQFGFRFRGFITFSIEAIMQYFDNASRRQSIYFYHKHIGFINRMNITFHFFFIKRFNYDQKIFINWLHSKGEEGFNLAQQIQSKDQNLKQLGKFLADNLSGQHSLLVEAIQLLRVTKNPGVIFNVAWLCSVLFNYIRQQYSEYKKIIAKEMKGSFITVWLKLTRQEGEILQKSVGQNFSFPTFTVGYRQMSTVSKNNGNYYKILINIPQNIKQFNSEVDFGFIVHQNHVIFNLLNTFKLDISSGQRQFTATYSSLGGQQKLRRQQFRYYKDAKPADIKMMMLYDYFCLLKKQISTQYDLLFFLQMYQKYISMVTVDASEKYTNKTISQSLASTIHSISQSNSNFKPLNEKVGDAYLQTGNLEAAIQHYDYVNPWQRGQIKKINLYFLKDKKPAFRQAIDGYINRRKQFQGKNRLNPFTEVAFSNFEAIMTDRRGDFSKTQKLLQENIEKMAKNFEIRQQFHSESYSNFPLYCMIQNTRINNCKLRGDQILKDLLEYQARQTELYFDGVHKLWLKKQKQQQQKQLENQ